MEEGSSIEAWKSVAAFRKGFELGLKGIRYSDDGGYADAFDQAAFTCGNSEGLRAAEKLLSSPGNDHGWPPSGSFWARFKQWWEIRKGRQLNEQKSPEQRSADR